ncbi:MAG: PDZ domain-containing protein [Calditrichaeota bacterium]|nr:PDZ domain-containing protein [Calditrichota bacterium]RQV93519.1 MAG: PDZ domain-containing protein [bacterium]RQW06433.1 MAG: PDZ domain-containing protein [Calditrichota bacterium]
MKFLQLFLILFLGFIPSEIMSGAHKIFQKNRDKICLVSFYQNIASDARIGSFDKIKQYRIGILVDPTGLVMVSNDVYPVSMDLVSSTGSLPSGLPSDFKVTLSDNNEHSATFLGKDDQAKVAFIRIEKENQTDSFPFVTFRKTESVQIGDTLFVLELLGPSYNYSPLFTSHLVNAVLESPRRKFLINNYLPALSAGGLVTNVNGEALGVTINQSFDFSSARPGDFDDFHKNYLEIAPSEWFVELIADPPDIEDNQVAQKSWLGIQMQALTKELKNYWKVPQEGGVVIDRVFAESPAAEAGLHTGDVILSVNDSILKVVEDNETAELRNIILTEKPGTVVDLTIFRNGKILPRKVKLTAAPKAIGRAESYPVPELGFEMRELTRDILYQEDLPLNTPGVFVYQVDRASPAGIGGLETGDIIQEINENPVSGLDDAGTKIEKLLEKKQKIFMLKVLSYRQSRFVFIDLEK